jgi:hypothetical protein
MEELKSNSEIRSEVAQWVGEVKNALDSDRSRKLSIVGKFQDPWTHAVAIGELISVKLRWREIAPNPSPRLRCLQVVHGSNLLDWQPTGHMVLRLRPDNIFSPPPRGEMIDALVDHLGEGVSIGDISKIEGGWAVAISSVLNIPETIPGFTLRLLTDDEIAELPPSTQTGPRSAVVASPRIDAVAAGVLKPSREQIKKHLESGGVLLNYQPASKSAKELDPGDIVAVRASGRFRLDEISGETKKGRIQIKAVILNGP